MHETDVERLYEEFSDLLIVLEKANEPSLYNVAHDNLRKALLIAAASYIERRLTSAVINFAEEVTSKDHVLTWLVKNKAVARQYHTWFDWDRSNANRFFGLFGESFKERMKTEVDKDNELKNSIEAFMEIGRERNRLVHQDFSSFPLEKTSREIYERYSAATKFVEWFPDAIKQFSKEGSSEDTLPPH